MQLEFQKTVLPCMRRVTWQSQNQEQTQEVRLSDGMPDIGKVLGAWGQVVLRGKEWRGSGIGVSGGVMTWVLYTPEEGGPPQCVQAWIPFQMKWDFAANERDGGILVQPLLRSVDARSTSARKLMVRASVELLADALTEGEAEVYTPGELPEDVHLLRNTYHMELPREAGEKAFLVDEVISLPSTAPAVDRILYYHVQPRLTEQKVMSDKVIFRGTADLHLVYLGTDGQLHNWNFEMPFSQFAELKGEYSPQARACVWLAVTSLELEPGEEEGYIWRTGLTGQYLIYDTQNVEVVEDAYSTTRPVTVQQVALQLPSVLNTQLLQLQPEGEFELEGVEIADAVFYPEHPRLYREGDQVTAEVGGMFQILGSDLAGDAVGHSCHWEGSQTLSADPGAKVLASAPEAGKLQLKQMGQSVSVSGDMTVNTVCISAMELPMVTGLELGEAQQPDPNRPSLILRRAGEDTLWQVAKDTGSTVEAIRKANNLQQDPPPNQMLLIPVQ